MDSGCGRYNQAGGAPSTQLQQLVGRFNADELVFVLPA